MNVVMARRDGGRRRRRRSRRFPIPALVENVPAAGVVDHGRLEPVHVHRAQTAQAGKHRYIRKDCFQVKSKFITDQ